MIKNFVVQKTVVSHADGTYLILRRSDTDTRKPLEWDLPGGMLDQGETFEAGAMREIVEEAGTKLEISHLLPRHVYSGVGDRDGIIVNVIKIIYTARAKSKQVELSFEHDIYEWVEAADFIDRFKSQPSYHTAISYIIDNKLDVLA